MFPWFIISSISYLFFGLSSFGDKLVLSGRPNQKSYAFYVGVLGILIVVVIPFTGIMLPAPLVLGWVILDALVYILAIFAMFAALEKFNVSKVVPAIGAVQPIFIFILTWLFFGPQTLKPVHLAAFLILLLGGLAISLGKTLAINKEYVGLVLFSSLMFSSDYIFSKIIFLHLPFLQGIIWIKVFCFLFAMLMLVDKKLRRQIFRKGEMLSKKTEALVVFAQSTGVVAGFLQSLAIALVPVAYLAIMNAMRGLQYAFLFIITLFFSLVFPNILKEELSKRIVLQKIISIFLIFTGLGLLLV